jgi:hypothetical protein
VLVSAAPCPHPGADTDPDADPAAPIPTPQNDEGVAAAQRDPSLYVWLPELGSNQRPTD